MILTYVGRVLKRPDRNWRGGIAAAATSIRCSLRETTEGKASTRIAGTAISNMFSVWKRRRRRGEKRSVWCRGRYQRAYPSNQSNKPNLFLQLVLVIGVWSSACDSKHVIANALDMLTEHCPDPSLLIG